MAMVKETARRGEAQDQAANEAAAAASFDPFAGRGQGTREALRLRAMRGARRAQAQAGFKPASEQASQYGAEFNRLAEDTAKASLKFAKGGAVGGEVRSAVRGAGCAARGLKPCDMY